MKSDGQTGHTPGPWAFEPHGAFGSDFLGEDWPLGYISREMPRVPIFALGPILELPTSELLANAHLIAAAPELLAALIGLQGILATAESNARGNPEWEAVSAKINAARAAIAKATGASS